MDLSRTNRYEIRLPDDLIFVVSGDLSGDKAWNNISAKILMTDVAYTRKYSAEIAPFSRNCGIKAVNSISFGPKSKIFLNLIESFLVHCCNCGIIVGSDFIEEDYPGSTGQLIKTTGTGYITTAPVWNPNYQHFKDHNIFLFYKYLNKDDYVNNWC